MLAPRYELSNVDPTHFVLSRIDGAIFDLRVVEMGTERVPAWCYSYRTAGAGNLILGFATSLVSAERAAAGEVDLPVDL